MAINTIFFGIFQLDTRSMFYHQYHYFFIYLFLNVNSHVVDLAAYEKYLVIFTSTAECWHVLVILQKIAKIGFLFIFSPYHF